MELFLPIPIFHFEMQLVGFSTVPLVFASFVGMLFCLLAFVGIGFVVIRALMFGDPVAGWPSMICVILLMGGLQLFS